MDLISFKMNSMITSRRSKSGEERERKEGKKREG